MLDRSHVAAVGPSLVSVVPIAYVPPRLQSRSRSCRNAVLREILT